MKVQFCIYNLTVGIVKKQYVHLEILLEIHHQITLLSIISSWLSYFRVYASSTFVTPNHHMYHVMK